MRINTPFILAAALCLLLIVSINVFLNFSEQKKSSSLPEVAKLKVNKVSKYDRIDLAMEHELEMTKDPALGIIPRERLIQAKLQMEQMSHFRAAIPNINWQERGPNNVGGRTRAIMVDPNDATRKTVFSASVAGGLWKTTNIFAPQPNWAPVNDFFENIAITTITYNPANTQVMYFGTGEGWYNSDAVRGNGIWKSTDGGNNWTQLTSTANPTFHYVQKMEVASNGHVFAATRNSGIQKSTDGGNTWTKVLGSGAGGMTNTAADVEIAANGDIYCALGIMTTDGIYKSTDGGNTFTKLTSGLPSSGYTRIELACAPSDANRVYAILNGSNNDALGIYRSINGGSNWTAVANPTISGYGTSNFCRSQGWYNLTMAVDPQNAGNVFIGGIDLLKSTNGGDSWTQISQWFGNGFPYVHADQHTIVFSPGSKDTIYFGNDGGIYLSKNGSTAAPTFQSKVSNYNVTQFYAAAMHPDSFSNHFLAGAQDNGTHRFSTSGVNTTVEVTGGDGAFCHIDQDQPQYQFTSYVYNYYRRSSNGGNSFTNADYDGSGRFINPTDYDNAGNKLYAAHDNGKYLRWENPQSGSTFTEVSVAAFSNQKVSAVTVSPNVANRVYFGFSNGLVVKVDNANTNTPTATVMNSNASGMNYYVSCIEVEKGNDNHLLVTFSNYGVPSVWETSNGGSSWASVEGNLPDMPVRWALFNPNNASQAIIATELGVWSTDNLSGSSTIWGASNSGLSNVRVDMLQVRSSDKLVIAATHGRGLFSTNVFGGSSNPPAANADFTSNTTVEYTNRPINFIDNSSNATSWLWNFGDGSTSTMQNPIKSYISPGKYTVSLTVNNGADTETKINYIHILPKKQTPYKVTDGGSFEINHNDFGSKSLSGNINIWERGVPSNTLTTLNSTVNGWKTDLDSNIINSTYSAALMTPVFDFSNAGNYSIKFRMSMQANFCNGPYTVQVHYSTNKGTTWTRLGNTSSVDPNGINWYNSGPAESCSISATLVNDQIGWANNFSNVPASYNTSFLAGNPDVVFRFVMYTETGYAGGYNVDGFMIDDFEITYNPVALPVELTSFNAELIKKTAELKWTTAMESNNSGFEIERAFSGENFTKIGFVKGAGNSTTDTDYSFEDSDLRSGWIYYRLKQIDNDGKVTYSDIKPIFVKDSEEIIVNVYPNPAIDFINVSVSLPIDKEFFIKLYDLQGRVYQKRSFKQNGQIHQLSLSINDLTPGIYFVEVSDDTGIRQTIRILKQ